MFNFAISFYIINRNFCSAIMPERHEHILEIISQFICHSHCSTFGCAHISTHSMFIFLRISVFFASSILAPFKSIHLLHRIQHLHEQQIIRKFDIFFLFFLSITTQIGTIERFFISMCIERKKKCRFLILIWVTVSYIRFNYDIIRNLFMNK